MLLQQPIGRKIGSCMIHIKMIDRIGRMALVGQPIVLIDICGEAQMATNLKVNVIGNAFLSVDSDF